MPLTRTVEFFATAVNVTPVPLHNEADLQRHLGIFLGDRTGAAAVLDRLVDHPALESPYCRAAYDALSYRIGRAGTLPISLPPDQPTNRLWLLSILADRAAEVEDGPELERLTRAQQAEVKRLAKELANPDDKAALDPLRDWIRNRLQLAMIGQGRDPGIERNDPSVPPPDPAVAARQWYRFSLAMVVVLIELISILAAVLLAEDSSVIRRLTICSRPRLWFTPVWPHSSYSGRC